MAPPHLFEFCDQSWIPAGSRACLFEVMEACNSGLRSFNKQVAESVIAIAREEQLDTIVEIGAGRAPITTCLAADSRCADWTLIPCDLTPDRAAFESLEQQYPGQVRPIYESVDVTRPHQWPGRPLLVFCGVMHHIPFSVRDRVVDELGKAGVHVAVFEPLKRNVLSMSLAALSFFPAAFLPITFARRPGQIRRMLWCWFLPIVPPMFAWDGVASCMRQWTEAEWRKNLAAKLPEHSFSFLKSGWNSMTVRWCGRQRVEQAAQTTQ